MSKGADDFSLALLQNQAALQIFGRFGTREGREVSIVQSADANRCKSPNLLC